MATSLDTGDSVSLGSTTSWSILDASGNTSLEFDSVIDFEYRAEMKIPTYPIEQGSFQSYNKVPVPYDCRMTVSCNGNGQMTRDEFLSSCESMRQSLDTVVIVTPDATYDSVNLTHYDYRRESRQGVSLLLVQLWFQEIRVAQSSTSTAQADGASTTQNGQVSTTDPTTSQSAAYNSTTIT